MLSSDLTVRLIKYNAQVYVNGISNKIISNIVICIMYLLKSYDKNLS